MSYRLVVTKLEPNPKYDEQLAERNRRREYGGSGMFPGEEYPSMIVESRRIDVELTDEEYTRIRQSLLEFWESRR